MDIFDQKKTLSLYYLLPITYYLKNLTSYLTLKCFNN